MFEQIVITIIGLSTLAACLYTVAFMSGMIYRVSRVSGISPERLCCLIATQSFFYYYMLYNA